MITQYNKCLCVCFMFPFKIHLKTDWRVSQQISGIVLPLISAQCSLQNTSALQWEAEHRSTCICNPARKAQHTYIRHMHIHTGPHKQTCSQTHTHAHVKVQRHSHTLRPTVWASTAFLSAFPFTVEKSALWPTVFPTFRKETARECHASAPRVRRKMDWCPSFMYQVFPV